MTHDAEFTESTPRSAAAERMRRHRQRRRDGLRCLTVEVRESEIDTLVRMGSAAIWRQMGVYEEGEEQ